MKIVLAGTAPGGEIWETGFWMSATGVHDEATAAAQAEVVAGTLNSTDSSGAMRITAATIWTAQFMWTKVTCYAYTGGTTAAYVGEYTLPSPRAGSVGSAPHPNQVALVLTLRTGASGRRNRGRMYLPASGAPTAANAQMVFGDISTLTTAWATAFTDINASDAGKIIVLSRTGGTFRQVSSVDSDTRLDVQRRRANRQAPVATSTGAVTP